MLQLFGLVSLLASFLSHYKNNLNFYVRLDSRKAGRKTFFNTCSTKHEVYRQERGTCQIT